MEASVSGNEGGSVGRQITCFVCNSSFLSSPTYQDGSNVFKDFCNKVLQVALEDWQSKSESICLECNEKLSGAQMTNSQMKIIGCRIEKKNLDENALEMELENLYDLRRILIRQLKLIEIEGSRNGARRTTGEERGYMEEFKKALWKVIQDFQRNHEEGMRLLVPGYYFTPLSSSSVPVSSNFDGFPGNDIEIGEVIQVKTENFECHINQDVEKGCGSASEETSEAIVEDVVKVELPESSEEDKARGEYVTKQDRRQFDEFGNEIQQQLRSRTVFGPESKNYNSESRKLSLNGTQSACKIQQGQKHNLIRTFTVDPEVIDLEVEKEANMSSPLTLDCDNGFSQNENVSEVVDIAANQKSKRQRLDNDNASNIFVEVQLASNCLVKRKLASGKTILVNATNDEIGQLKRVSFTERGGDAAGLTCANGITVTDNEKVSNSVQKISRVFPEAQRTFTKLSIANREKLLNPTSIVKVYEYIFKFIDTPLELKSIRLVNKEWNIASRPQIFNRLTIESHRLTKDYPDGLGFNLNTNNFMTPYPYTVTRLRIDMEFRESCASLTNRTMTRFFIKLGKHLKSLYWKTDRFCKTQICFLRKILFSYCLKLEDLTLCSTKCGEFLHSKSGMEIKDWGTRKNFSLKSLSLIHYDKCIWDSCRWTHNRPLCLESLTETSVIDGGFLRIALNYCPNLNTLQTDLNPWKWSPISSRCLVGKNVSSLSVNRFTPDLMPLLLELELGLKRLSIKFKEGRFIRSDLTKILNRYKDILQYFQLVFSNTLMDQHSVDFSEGFPELVEIIVEGGGTKCIITGLDRCNKLKILKLTSVYQTLRLCSNPEEYFDNHFFNGNVKLREIKFGPTLLQDMEIHKIFGRMLKEKGTNALKAISIDCNQNDFSDCLMNYAGLELDSMTVTIWLRRQLGRNLLKSFNLSKLSSCIRVLKLKANCSYDDSMYISLRTLEEMFCENKNLVVLQLEMFSFYEEEVERIARLLAARVYSTKLIGLRIIRNIGWMRQAICINTDLNLANVDVHIEKWLNIKRWIPSMSVVV